MKLTFFPGANFGDALNDYLLPQVFPDFFDEDDSTLFVGIGSILNDVYPRNAQKIVFGSGYGGYAALPTLDETWKIYAVRGPRTADLLGLDRSLVAADSAILINKFRKTRPPLRHKFSYMPHWAGLRVGRWKEVAEEVGINFIDPRWPVERCLSELEATEVMIAEAMHGIITADALRIPWIALTPLDEQNRSKWQDWAEPLEIVLRPQNLVPSSVQEALLTHLGPKRSRWPRAGFRITGASRLADIPFKAAARKSLENAMMAEPSLSSDRAMDRALDKLETSAFCIKRDYPATLGI